MARSRLAHIILIALAIVAVMVLVSAPTTTFPSAPTSDVSLDGPSVADSDGESTVIVDRETQRLLFLDANGNLAGMFRCDTFDTPINAISDACIYNGEVYVVGVLFKPDSDEVSQERVIVFDKAGNQHEVLYQIPGSPSGQRNIITLSTTSRGVVALVQNEGGSADGGAEDGSSTELGLSFILLGEEGNQKLGETTVGGTRIYDGDYSEDGNFVTLSLRGIINDTDIDIPSAYPGRVFTAIAAKDGETYYASDDKSGALCLVKADGTVNEIVAGTGFTNIRLNGDILSLCDTELDTVKLCGLDGTVRSEIDSVSPAVGFAMRVAAMWASLIYLIALVAVLLIRKLRKLVKTGHTKGIGPMLASLAVVLAVGMAVGQSSWTTYQESIDVRAHEIGMGVDFLSMNDVDISESLMKINDRDLMRQSGDELRSSLEDFLESIQLVSSYTYAASENDIGLYFMVYGKDESGVFYIAGSENEDIYGTSLYSAENRSVIEEAFEGEWSYDDRLYEGETTFDRSLYRIVQIPDDAGGIAGVIEIGSHMNSFGSSLQRGLASRILGLLVVMLVVYLSYSELRGCANSLFSYRELRRKSMNDAIATLTRPYSFCITLIINIDGVMTVLIARDILSATSTGSTGLLIALPSILLGVGMVVGQMLYGVISPRVSLRSLVAGWAGALMVFAVFAVVAVTTMSFWAYCAAKLLMAIPFGLLYAVGISMPRAADSGETHDVAAGGITRTDTSAAALGLILGGYAAQALGNAWVYIIAAIACLPLLLLAFYLLPREFGSLEESSSLGILDDIANIFRYGKTLLTDLLVIIPMVLSFGFAQFLFPLEAAGLGFAKADINNVVVLSQLVVYISIAWVASSKRRYGEWRPVVVAVAVMGIVFLSLSVNSTLVWWIAVIAILAVMAKIVDGWKGLWPAKATDAGLPLGMATGTMLAVKRTASAIQPAILTGLLALGAGYAVLIIGAFCLVCAIVFFLVTRKHSHRPE